MGSLCRLVLPSVFYGVLNIAFVPVFGPHFVLSSVFRCDDWQSLHSTDIMVEDFGRSSHEQTFLSGN